MDAASGSRAIESLSLAMLAYNKINNIKRVLQKKEFLQSMYMHAFYEKDVSLCVSGIETS